MTRCRWCSVAAAVEHRTYSSMTRRGTEASFSRFRIWLCESCAQAEEVDAFAIRRLNKLAKVKLKCEE